jgi:cysteinyl-tRNA synthetase
VTVRLYDSRAQAVVDLTTLEPGRVGMYVCGPTVQSSPHIGHLRSALVYDLWRRWLTHSGYDVTLVRNVTDIDDKILDAAKSTGDAERWWALAYRVELEFTAGYNALGILPPTYEPRATASIAEMRDLIQRLIDTGHAYAAAGDVYFDTASWPTYGELTRQKPENMEAASDADPRGKREPRDFALWKGTKEGEPASASWPSPWGPGRPGWHIECSAMSRRYLGPAFDIHGGGLDLRFPHHENELAQSTAAGDPFATFWLHNGLVNVNGQKMAKSLGNSVYASELLAQTRPVVLRYFLGSAHYRSTIDFTDGSLAEASGSFGRIESFLIRVQRVLGGLPEGSARDLPAAFTEAMDDDLNVPRALAALHESISLGNLELDSAADLKLIAEFARSVRTMTEVLGVYPFDPFWSSAASDGTTQALAALVEGLLEARVAARAAKDFTEADRIRDQLTAAGISIEDAADRSHWSVQP